jgi:hypothetical protein
MKIIIPDGQTTWLVTERVDPLILVVAEKPPGLSETLGKETSCGDGFTARAANTSGRDNAAQLSGNQKSWRLALS